MPLFSVSAILLPRRVAWHTGSWPDGNTTSGSFCICCAASAKRKRVKRGYCMDSGSCCIACCILHLRPPRRASSGKIVSFRIILSANGGLSPSPHLVFSPSLPHSAMATSPRPLRAAPPSRLRRGGERSGTSSRPSRGRLRLLPRPAEAQIRGGVEPGAQAARGGAPRSWRQRLCPVAEARGCSRRREAVAGSGSGHELELVLLRLRGRPVRLRLGGRAPRRRGQGRRLGTRAVRRRLRHLGTATTSAAVSGSSSASSSLRRARVNASPPPSVALRRRAGAGTAPGRRRRTPCSTRYFPCTLPVRSRTARRDLLLPGVLLPSVMASPSFPGLRPHAGANYHESMREGGSFHCCGSSSFARRDHREGQKGGRRGWMNRLFTRIFWLRHRHHYILPFFTWPNCQKRERERKENIAFRGCHEMEILVYGSSCIGCIMRKEGVPHAWIRFVLNA
jgi:hypothetical protein